MRPPDKAKAAIKVKQRTKPAKPRGRRKLCSLVFYSGADGHYPTEELRKAAGLKVIRKSTKKLLVADGHVNHGEQEVELPFKGLSTKARTGDTFERFRKSLMSVGKVNDNGNISIFTKDDVTVYKEEDVFITCKGKPILIGIRNKGGRYRIPLDQRQKGQWRPRIPTKTEGLKQSQANSFYDLPYTEQAIKWMHAVCGYPVKSTWVKAVQAGNFVGWPLLTVKNVNKYYPEISETPRHTWLKQGRTYAPPNPNHSRKATQKH